MQAGAYNASSVGQLAAHEITYPALQRALERVVQLPGPTLRLTDLGCAGGANALHVAQRVAKLLEELGEAREVEYAFEDLPANDFNALFGTLKEARLPTGWYISAVGRSFYEPCFPAGSQHLALSYITVHWLSTPACDVGPGAVLPNERGVTAAVVAAWRRQAHVDLVQFLAMRARELCDGGEGVFLMVGGGPHGWVQPPVGGSSIFSQALARAVADGSLDPAAAAAAVVPYFLRTEDDARAAAAQVPDLELLETRAASIAVAEGLPIEQHVALAWAIHGNAFAASMHTSEAALASVRAHLHEVIAENFSDGRGASVSYLAMAVRRRNRNCGPAAAGNS